MIKAILFDNFGVLADEVYGSIIKTLPQPDIEKILQISELADLGQITEQQRAQSVAPLVEGGTDLINSYYMRAQINEPLLALIRELKKEYKIGLLSNAASGVIEKFFSSESLDQHFDDIVVSHEVHITKPDPEIYQLAAQRLGIETTECVFVDDRESNIDGAKAVGMTGIVYRNFDQLKQELSKILGEDVNARTTRS